MNTLTATDRDKVLSRCKWWADSGYEWLQVPLSAARKADKADKANGGDGISTFSYIKGTNAYLEGDCDAKVFFRHFELTEGELISLSLQALVIDGPAPVRDYPRWEA